MIAGGGKAWGLEGWLFRGSGRAAALCPGKSMLLTRVVTLGWAPVQPTRWGVLQTMFPTGAEAWEGSRAPAVRRRASTISRARITISIGMHRNADRSPRETQCLSRAGKSQRKHASSRRRLTKKMGEEIKNSMRCRCQILYCGRRN